MVQAGDGGGGWRGGGQCQWNEEKLENVLSLRCLRNTRWRYV